ncbi:hypothetical protein HYFRA_00006877 [Hymenoscyphus fraxineus]|uniref:HhH-GPD domain-containing protein n=1 Tax=Hymenoscyphus fraxineus TaxID=746836 RepID=A0A9N9KMB5_9HELO|nr:hypothetical protein HYFRA_00006877 [Hymenoscyphus fraxineus]
MSGDQSEDSIVSDISDISSFARWEAETGEKILDERELSRRDMADLAIPRVWADRDSSNDLRSSDEDVPIVQVKGTPKRVGKIKYTRAPSVSSSSSLDSDFEHPPSSQPRPIDSEPENEDFDDPLADFDVDPSQREYMMELLDFAPEEELAQLSQPSPEPKKLKKLLEMAHGKGLEQLSQLAQGSIFTKKDKKRKRKSVDVGIENVMGNAMAVVAAGIAGDTGEGFQQAMSMATAKVKEITSTLTQENSQIITSPGSEAAESGKSRKKRHRQKRQQSETIKPSKTSIEGNNARTIMVKDIAPILETATDWYQGDDAIATVIDIGIAEAAEQEPIENSVPEKQHNSVGLVMAHDDGHVPKASQKAADVASKGIDREEITPADNKLKTMEDKNNMKAARRAAKKAKKAEARVPIPGPVNTAQVADSTVPANGVDNNTSDPVSVVSGDAKSKNAARRAARKAKKKKKKLGPTTSKFFPPGAQSTGSPGPALRASPEERRNKKLAVRKATANSNKKTATNPVPAQVPEQNNSPKNREEIVRKLAKELKLTEAAVNLLLSAREAVENSVNNPLPGTTTRPTFSETTKPKDGITAGSAANNAVPGAGVISKSSRKKRNKKARNHNALKEASNPPPISKPVPDSTPKTTSDQHPKNSQKGAQGAVISTTEKKAEVSGKETMEVDSAPGPVQKSVEKSEQKKQRRDRGRRGSKGKKGTNGEEVIAETTATEAVELQAPQTVRPEMENSNISLSEKKSNKKKRKSLDKRTEIPKTQDSQVTTIPSQNSLQEPKSKTKKRKSFSTDAEVADTQSQLPAEEPSQESRPKKKKRKSFNNQTEIPETQEYAEEPSQPLIDVTDNQPLPLKTKKKKRERKSKQVSPDLDSTNVDVEMGESSKDHHSNIHTEQDNHGDMEDVENGEGSGSSGDVHESMDVTFDVDENDWETSSNEAEEAQPRTPSRGFSGSSNHKSSMPGSKRKAIGLKTAAALKKSRTSPRVTKERPIRGRHEIVTPVDEDPEEGNEEPVVVSVPKTPQGISHSKRERARLRTLQRELGIVAPVHEEGNEDPFIVSVPKTPQTSSHSKRERARLRTLQRELGIVAPAQEDNKHTPISRKAPKSTERITPKDRTRRSILRRELGIFSSTDEELSDLREESRNRRTSSAACERISRLAEYEAQPVNVFDEVFGDSDLELPKPRRSSESQVYLHKDGYKKLVGVRSRFPTSDDESVFEPSMSRCRHSTTNSSPLRDTKSKVPPAGNSSAVKTRSVRKGREGSRSSTRNAIVPTPRIESPQDLGRSLIRRRPKLFKNKTEIPSSSAEEESNSELRERQSKPNLNANKKTIGQSSNNRSAIRPHEVRPSINNTARIPFPAALPSVSGEASLRSTKSDGSSSAGPANNKTPEYPMGFQRTKPATGMQSNTSRRRDSVSASSPAVMRMKRNKVADFFEDYESRGLPTFSDVDSQEEPASMTIRGDTQMPVEEELMAAREATQMSIDEPFSTAPMLQSDEEASPDSSYRTAVEEFEQESTSQQVQLKAISPLKSVKKKISKRQPAKSPYFSQTTESPKKGGKAKAAETDNPIQDVTETPNTPKKRSAASPNKRSPGGIVSCIPFPPLSSPTFGIIQEKLAHDPFRLLIAVTFLNRTRGKTAVPVFYELMKRYPTPEALASAPKEDIVDIIRHLGFQNQRADTFKKYGQQWVEDPPMKDKRYAVRGYPEQDSGRDIKSDEILTDEDPRIAWEIGHMTQGPYAIDSWRIFCRDILRGVADSWNGENAKEENFQPEWMRVVPADKELRAYLRWMWLKEGFHWDPFTGEKEVAGRVLMVAAMEGRIAWDDFGGLRILDGDDGDETGNEKGKDIVDTGEVGEELDVNAVGVDGPPAERSLR